MTAILFIDPMNSRKTRDKIYNEAINSRHWEYGFVVGHTLNSMAFAFYLRPAQADEEPDSLEDMELAYQKCLETRNGTCVHPYAPVYLEVL